MVSMLKRGSVMNNKTQSNGQWPKYGKNALLAALSLAITLAPVSQPVFSANLPNIKTAALADASAIEFSPRINATLGKSALLKLPESASRVSVGDKDIADIILLNPREIYILGKKVGSTNIMLWSKNGQSTVVDVNVSMDANALADKLLQLFPNEKNIKIS